MHFSFLPRGFFWSSQKNPFSGWYLTKRYWNKFTLPLPAYFLKFWLIRHESQLPLFFKICFYNTLMIFRQRPPSLCLLFIEEKVRTITPILDSPVNSTSYMIQTLNYWNARWIVLLVWMRNACMTKRQLDLKLGPILGQITELLDSWPWKRKWANTHTGPGVMCHAQVLAGQWSIKIKAVAFCSFRMSEPQITAHFW